jgi:hypothetical protein
MFLNLWSHKAHPLVNIVRLYRLAYCSAELRSRNSLRELCKVVLKPCFNLTTEGKSSICMRCLASSPRTASPKIAVAFTYNFIFSKPVQLWYNFRADKLTRALRSYRRQGRAVGRKFTGLSCSRHENFNSCISFCLDFLLVITRTSQSTLSNWLHIQRKPRLKSEK